MKRDMLKEAERYMSEARKASGSVTTKDAKKAITPDAEDKKIRNKFNKTMSKIANKVGNEKFGGGKTNAGLQKIIDAGEVFLKSI